MDSIGVTPTTSTLMTPPEAAPKLESANFDEDHEFWFVVLWAACHRPPGTKENLHWLPLRQWEPCGVILVRLLCHGARLPRCTARSVPACTTKSIGASKATLWDGTASFSLALLRPMAIERHKNVLRPRDRRLLTGIATALGMSFRPCSGDHLEPAIVRMYQDEPRRDKRSAKGAAIDSLPSFFSTPICQIRKLSLQDLQISSSVLP
nr:hypothetical protein CFP56_00722 [Quercus suber]